MGAKILPMPEDVIDLKAYIATLEKSLGDAATVNDLYDRIVNAPFYSRLDAGSLFLGIVVLLILNEEENQIDRVALSDTELADLTRKVSVVPFKDIKIPADDPDNIIAKAVRDNKHQSTTDWKYLFTPILDEKQARINQAGGGIACRYVYPIESKGMKGALIFSYFQYLHAISDLHEEFMKRYASIVSDQLSRLSDDRSIKSNKA